MMMSLFKHGVKLTIYHFLGFLLNFVLSFLLTILFYILVLLTVVGTIGAIGGVNLFTDYILNEKQFEAIVSSIAVVPFLIIIFLYVLFVMILQSMLIGGLYGSTIESVYENRSSVRSYFAHSFRHIWRLTSVQLAQFFIALPITLGLVLGNVAVMEAFGEVFGFLSILVSLVIMMLILTVYLHTPIFVVRLRTKVWRSIALTFRLLLVSPFRTFFACMLFLGTNILINGLYVLTVSVPAVLGYYLLEGVFAGGVLEVVLAIYLLIVILIWGLIIIPFTGTFSLLLLVRHYRQHFEPIVEPMGMGGNVYQDGPLFQMKRK